MHNVPKYLAHSFVLTSNLHHDVKVQHQRFLRSKTSSHDNHILSHAPSQNHPQSMPVECHACLFHTQTIPQQETKLSNVCRCNTGTDFLNATWCCRGSSITHCSFYFHDRSATHSAFASDQRLLQITETVNRCPRSCITILSTPGTTGTYENI